MLIAGILCTAIMIPHFQWRRKEFRFPWKKPESSGYTEGHLEQIQIEKLILGDGKHLIINPVEPLNTPKEITPNLLIEFEKTLLLAGGAKKKIFLTFPIEIGVFISDKENKNLQLLDVLSSGETEIYSLWGGFKWSNLQALEKQYIFNFPFP